MVKGLIQYNNCMNMLFVQANDTSFMLEFLDNVAWFVGYREGVITYRTGSGNKELNLIELIDNGKIVSSYLNELRENLLKLEEKNIEFC